MKFLDDIGGNTPRPKSIRTVQNIDPAKLAPTGSPVKLGLLRPPCNMCCGYHPPALRTPAADFRRPTPRLRFDLSAPVAMRHAMRRAQGRACHEEAQQHDLAAVGQHLAEASILRPHTLARVGRGQAPHFSSATPHQLRPRTVLHIDHVKYPSPHLVLHRMVLLPPLACDMICQPSRVLHTCMDMASRLQKDKSSFEMRGQLA